MTKINHAIDPNNIPIIEPNEVFKLMGANIRFIDVRRSDEYTGELGHIKGSKLVNLESQFTNFIQNESDKVTPIIFICRSGARSAKTTQMAQEQGFQNVYNMSGGMMAWNALGLPIEK